MLTDGKVIVLADDEGVNTIVEAVDGSGVVRTGYRYRTPTATSLRLGMPMKTWF